MQSPKSELLRQSHRIGVRFLLAEADTGLTFLSIAASAAPNDGHARHLKNAREAYCIVERLTPRVHFSPQEKQELELKMQALRSGLAAAGCSLDCGGEVC